VPGKYIEKMQPEIKTLQEKKLIGKSLKMSLAANKTADLWKSFMPFRNTISNALSPGLFSLQVYEPSYFKDFSPDKEFEKWALKEVSDWETIPEGMKPFRLSEGLYAVFHYKGSSTSTEIFDYILGTWLPASTYSLDNRPHFQILGEKYKNADPESEEDLWIPIKPK
jgi:AraC family transcriptional regulator